MEWNWGVLFFLIAAASIIVTENFLSVREDIRATRKTVEEILETLRERG